MGPHVQVDVEMSFRVTKPGPAAFVVALAGGATQEEFAYPAPPRQVAFETGPGPSSSTCRPGSTSCGTGPNARSTRPTPSRSAKTI